ncbi:MAG TPA: YCF48-related protein [Prolixibacteraceae bacterium]|nr:YCF48-related protein [Prolixibacteraceae bacterium]
MKKIIFILLTLHGSLFTVHCSFSQQYGWIDLSANIPDSNNIHKNILDVYFIGQEGWITGGYYSDAKIYHTSDGGMTFTNQPLPANTLGYGMSIAMRSPLEGYFVTNNGHVLRTMDGGNSWVTIGTGLGLLYSISFPPLPDTSGYICGGSGGKVCRVTGNTVAIEFTTPATLTSITFPENSNNGWVCGEYVIRYRNSTGWHVPLYDPIYYNAICFVDSLNGWAVGVNGVIIKTTNGWDWVAQNNPDNNSLNDVFFLNAQEGWAVGDNIILHTTDGGINWVKEAESLTDSTLLTGVFALNNHEVYVVGHKSFGVGVQKCLFLKYTVISGTEDKQRPGLVLRQNQPNPFSQSTVISYQLAVGSHVFLKVCDFMGREIRTLVDSDITPGEHQVTLDASGLPPGVYFSQIRVNGIVETKKMIKLK